jgi:ABC-type transport system involved in multi-copper enzyme maturation permease subunit
MNKVRIWKALARGVLLESLRRKDLWVVAILGFLIICAAGALGFFGITGLEAFAKDLGVTVLGLFSTIMAVLTSCRLLPDEIKQRTLYPLLSRPISRFDLLFGKWLGAVLVTWIAFLLLCLLTAGALASFHVHFEPIMAQYVIAKMMGLAVVCAVSLALGTWMTPQAAATLSFILAFGSTLIVRALLMAYDSGNPAMAWVFKLINAILPQYSLFDLGGRAANIGWAPVPLWVMGFLLLYMIVYSFGMLGLSWSKFRRQAI